MDLSYCKFSRSIPTSIDNLKSLHTLDLSHCEFSGSIPISLENLTQITSLFLHGNHFSGNIPNVFNNLRNLISLGLSSNNFSGQLPPLIQNLTNLQELGFSHNFNLFNWTILSWLYTLPSLVGLDLSHNKLTSPIGEFQFDSLEYIDLSMNELHGSIPSSTFKLVNLEIIFL